MFNFKDELSRYQPIMEIDQIEDALQPSQMQDLLELDGSARMNTPGNPYGNWRWRMLPGAADKKLAKKLREYTETYRRLNDFEK